MAFVLFIRLRVNSSHKANVLVDSKGCALLADFGVTDALSKTIVITQIGPQPVFQAPEVYSPSEFGYDDMFFGNCKTDIFAFASLCYEVRL